MGLLDGKVAIITGSGGGIGRCHALLFAKEGAKVVVNDLGGSRDGSGNSTKMADTVVNEIKAMGGQAVANYDSVASMDGSKNLIKTAIDAFGRADILVNNAGILRDKTLQKMNEQEWDLVIAVHLKGTFACTQAFVAHVKERAEKGDVGGRIVNTSSYAGLIGNFGQSNYAAAKAGIYGLTKVWALELAKLGVTVNCIAPMAKTRMTEDIAQVPDDMKPEQISPMVLFLCSEGAKDLSGKIFGIHGQQLLEYKMIMTPGVTKPGTDFWTPAEIKEKLAAIGAEPNAAPAAGAAAPAAVALTPEQIIDKAFQRLPEIFVADKAKGWTANVQFNIAGGSPWTVKIGDGKCTTVKGLDGTPTCTVKTDVATWADIILGKERAEKAFMAGKVSATNLGDMMKFGGAFDMKKAQAMAEAEKAAAGGASVAAAAAPARALGPAEIIAQAFARMPEIFVADKAKGWNANIHFEIKEAGDWSVKIADGKCTIAKAKEGTATCVVKTDAQTWSDIVTGKERAEKAFMGGKITASNLGDMMKLGSAFDMKKAAELLKSTGGAAPAGAAPAAAAPAAADTPAAAIERAMKALPAAFKPDGAAGWNAVIQFEISGADNWTVSIQGGKCETSKGKNGTATCVVKTDAATYSAIAKGELKAEQAFMQQKISASNLGDMMKFGRAFDMKKAAELARASAPTTVATGAPAGGAAPAAAAAAPAAGADTPAAAIERAMKALPAAYKPEGASGWNAVIQFQISGADDWTVSVQNGKCETSKGKNGTATCVVKTDAATYAAIAKGELKAEQAFMQQKISASNLGDMMKFGRAFDMKKAAELAKGGAPAASAAPAAPAPSAPPKGLNRALIGNSYSGGFFWVKGEDTKAYALATNDSNPLYLDDARAGGPIAPPLYAVRLAKDVLFKMLMDPDLNCNLLRLVHGEQDMEFLRPLRPWDLAAVRATIAGIDEKSSGELLHAQTRLYVNGELCVRARGTMFIRGEKRKDDGAKKDEAPADEAAGRKIAFSQPMTVTPDQSVRYAGASLDNNPIHMDEAVAKSAGLPGVILQGLCTMAFAQKAIVDEVLEGDATRLARLAVRFAKPVLMGDKLVTEGWEVDTQAGKKTYGFRVKNQDGVVVISNGIAEVRS